MNKHRKIKQNSINQMKKYQSNLKEQTKYDSQKVAAKKKDGYSYKKYSIQKKQRGMTISSSFFFVNSDSYTSDRL